MKQRIWGRWFSSKKRSWQILIAGLACGLLVSLGGLIVGCAEFVPEPPVGPNTADPFVAAEIPPSTLYSNPDEVAAFSAQVPEQYLLGPGDVLSLKVWNRPELSNADILVGPDGTINMILVGEIDVNGRTRQSVADEIKNIPVVMTLVGGKVVYEA